MSLETASTIAQLQSSAPSASDPVNQGDDHIRMIKYVLKNIFPGSGGQGFSIPIVATEAEINFLDGVTSNIQTQLNSLQSALSALLGTLPAPVGTRLTFFQSAPPTGWSLVADYDNHMLRVVNTAGGGFGGSDSPILNNKVPSHVHSHTLVADLSGSHQHRHQAGPHTSWWQGYAIGYGNFGGGTPDDAGYIAMTEANGAHTHTISGSINPNGGAANWTPKYLDMVIGQKS